MMTHSGLDIQGASKVIGKETIVHPFDLQVQPGVVLALCGGNGAGKSTILRMIVGLLQATTGTIQVNGLTWAKDRKAYAKVIGYMPDQYQFGAALTARETLRFFAALKGVGNSRADELLQRVGLVSAQHKPVTAFSKGMQQRLLFAQTLLEQPPLLILDEPTNGLDPYWAENFIELVREVKQAGQSVVFSTHHLHIAEEVADEAVFLKSGRIVSSGSIRHYREIYGSSGLNGAFAEYFMEIQPKSIDMALR